MNEFRILAIDGGGIKGLFPASLLTAVERELGRPIGSHFDLITGTSTGGIIALGLGLGFSAEQMKRFYIDFGPSIFPRRTRWRKTADWFRRLLHIAYGPQQLRTAVNSCFGARKLGESQRRLVIPSMDANTGKVYVFKTSHHDRLQMDYKQRVGDVALATAAAPTYFPAHLVEGVRLLDGGMWANNPALVAVIEAVYVLNVPVERVRVLSIGCSEFPMCLSQSVGESGGQLSWANQVADWFMRGQSESVNGMVQLMLGKQNVMRIQPVAPQGRFSLDDFDSAMPLIGMGETTAREQFAEIKARFLYGPAEPFFPAHALSPTELHVAA